jgi:hypothetical protein
MNLSISNTDLLKLILELSDKIHFLTQENEAIKASLSSLASNASDITAFNSLETNSNPPGTCSSSNSHAHHDHFKLVYIAGFGANWTVSAIKNSLASANINLKSIHIIRYVSKSIVEFLIDAIYATPFKKHFEENYSEFKILPYFSPLYSSKKLTKSQKELKLFRFIKGALMAAEKNHDRRIVNFYEEYFTKSSFDDETISNSASAQKILNLKAVNLLVSDIQTGNTTNSKARLLVKKYFSNSCSTLATNEFQTPQQTEKLADSNSETNLKIDKDLITVGKKIQFGLPSQHDDFSEKSLESYSDNKILPQASITLSDSLEKTNFQFEPELTPIDRKIEKAVPDVHDAFCRVLSGQSESREILSGTSKDSIDSYLTEKFTKKQENFTKATILFDDVDRIVTTNQLLFFIEGDAVDWLFCVLDGNAFQYALNKAVLERNYELIYEKISFFLKKCQRVEKNVNKLLNVTDYPDLESKFYSIQQPLKQEFFKLLDQVKQQTLLLFIEKLLQDDLLFTLVEKLCVLQDKLAQRTDYLIEDEF